MHASLRSRHAPHRKAPSSNLATAGYSTPGKHLPPSDPSLPPPVPIQSLSPSVVSPTPGAPSLAATAVVAELVADEAEMAAFVRVFGTYGVDELASRIVRPMLRQLLGELDLLLRQQRPNLLAMTSCLHVQPAPATSASSSSSSSSIGVNNSSSASSSAGSAAGGGGAGGGGSTPALSSASSALPAGLEEQQRRAELEAMMSEAVDKAMAVCVQVREGGE